MILLFSLFACKKHGQDDSSTQGYGWNYLGNPDFTTAIASNPIVACNPVDGVPYIAYNDGVNDGWHTFLASVMKYNGTTWVYVGTPDFSSGQPDNLSFAFNANGEPFVAYIDAQNYFKLGVMKFNGSTWEDVGDIGLSSAGTECMSIAINPANGQPYLLFSDHSDSNKASVIKYNGSTWVYLGSSGFSHGVMEYTSAMAFNPVNHQPYVVFDDKSDSDNVHCMTFNGTEWVNVGSSGLNSPRAIKMDIAISSSGQAYIAISGQSPQFKASVLKLVGDLWVNVGPTEFYPSKVHEMTIVVCPTDNQPYVCFMDYNASNKATVMRFNGNNWIPIGTEGFTSDIAINPTLAVNSSGHFFVGYKDQGNIQKASVMFYAP